MPSIQDLVDRLLAHPIYYAVRDERALRVFMRAHVFCVWDFMALLKSLQRALTCVDVPWFPTGDRAARRFINEIVLAEESDPHPAGGFASHFELYHEAMRDCGADTRPVDEFLARVRAGQDVRTALGDPAVPRGVAEFVASTFAVIETGGAHRIAAAFAFGREDVIPDMFRRLVKGLAQDAPAQWGTFFHYLNRHIEVDGAEHGPLAEALFRNLCGDDLVRRREAEESARAALTARIHLWDAVLADIQALEPEPLPAALSGTAP